MPYQSLWRGRESIYQDLFCLFQKLVLPYSRRTSIYLQSKQKSWIMHLMYKVNSTQLYETYIFMIFLHFSQKSANGRAEWRNWSWCISFYSTVPRQAKLHLLYFWSKKDWHIFIQRKVSKFVFFISGGKGNTAGWRVLCKSLARRNSI